MRIFLHLDLTGVATIYVLSGGYHCFAESNVFKNIVAYIMLSYCMILFLKIIFCLFSFLIYIF